MARPTSAYRGVGVKAFSVNGKVVGGSVQPVYYHRTRLDPQVKPPPMASMSTNWPFLIRPSATAVANASGTDAADPRGDADSAGQRHQATVGRAVP